MEKLVNDLVQSIDTCVGLFAHTMAYHFAQGYSRDKILTCTVESLHEDHRYLIFMVKVCDCVKLYKMPTQFAALNVRPSQLMDALLDLWKSDGLITFHYLDNVKNQVAKAKVEYDEVLRKLARYYNRQLTLQGYSRTKVLSIQSLASFEYIYANKYIKENQIKEMMCKLWELEPVRLQTLDCFCNWVGDMKANDAIELDDGIVFETEDEDYFVETKHITRLIIQKGSKRPRIDVD
jgi:hypothetical protein